MSEHDLPAANELDEHLPVRPSRRVRFLNRIRLDSDAPRGTRWLAVIALGVSLFTIVGIAQLVNGEWPIAGDQIHQNWWLTQYRSHIAGLLRGGHLFGWTDDYGAGQPYGYFYFPLPAIVYSAISVVFGGPVSAKLIQLIGIGIVPYGTWRAARALTRGTTPARASSTAVFAALAAVAAAVLPQKYPLGGNIQSTLIGEYSYAWSLGFAVWFLAELYQYAKTGKRYMATVLLGAATVLSHANVAFVIAPIAAVLVLWALISEIIRHRKTPPGMSETAQSTMGDSSQPSGPTSTVITRVLRAGVSVLGLGAFWLLPLVSMHGEAQPNNKVGHLSLWLWFEVLEWRVIAVAGVIGLVVGIVRKSALSYVFATAAAVSTGVYLYVDSHPSFPLWAARTIPVLQLALVVGVAELVAMLVALTRRHSGRISVAVAIAALLGSVGFVNVRSHQDAYGKRVEALSKVWLGAGIGNDGVRANIDALVDTMNGLEPGRILISNSGGGKQYGADDLNGELARRVRGFGGASTFFHEGNRGRSPLNQARSTVDQTIRLIDGRAGLGTDDFDSGIEMMRQFGVRYYIVDHPEMSKLAREDKRLRLLDRIGSSTDTVGEYFEVYEIDQHGIVEALTRDPGISASLPLWGESTWEGKAVEWVRHLTAIPNEASYLVDDAPLQYDWIGKQEYPPVKITNLVVTDEMISFDVDRIGVPTVIRNGYSPQWKASGADGPFLAAPNTMIVVPLENHVEVYFEHPKTERLGLGISVLTVAWMIRSALRRRRLRTQLREAVSADGGENLDGRA
jgi:hypothetical protein